MSHLYLRLLGESEVRHDDVVLHFPTRKTLALLVYLVVEGGQHTRKDLTTRFWPEQSMQRGRAALRLTLSRLRETLGEAEHSSTSAHLLVERETLGINPDANIVTDLQQLHQGWTAAQKLIDRATSDRSKSRAALEAAASQYHGDFLHDFALNDAPDFDVWVSTQRELWRQRTELVLDQLSLLQTDSGAYAEALATVQRWLELDPLREEAHRRVIRLHLAMGDRSAALRAYDACRAILAKELQAEPSPETVALAEQIRNAVLPQWSARTPARLQEADPERPLSSLDDAPLVGRAAEFARIIVAYHAARRGQSQVVGIEGEPGLGKTRLATEALSWTAAQGADVLQGRAFEAGGRLPYGPLVEALRPRVERERAPDDLLPDVWLTELSRLLPELRDRYPDLPLPTGDDATVKTRLFEAIVRLVIALAERAPIVLFVDDIQWADSATLDVLLYAVRRWSELGASVLLVVTMRPEATAPESGLTAWLKGIAGDATLTRLRLEPLAQTDALQFVQALAAIDEGAGVPSDTVQQFSTWLFTETGGQPLFVIETMKMVLERGPSAAQRRADGSWAIDMAAALRETSMLRATVAPGVRDVIQARLAQASPATRTLLNAAAVLGSAFTFAQLCMVSGVDEDSALEALEEALAKRLVRQLEPVHSLNRAERYTFSHDNIRTVVYGQMSTIRQQILHRRAYELLAASAAPAAQLAHHALAARLSEPALHASIAAGNAAMAVFAVRDALPHYQAARTLIGEGTASLTPNDQRVLYERLGRAYELTSDLTQARHVYTEMLAAARTNGAANMMCAALNRLALVVAQQSYDLTAAEELLREAQQLATETNDQPALAETEVNLAQIGFYGWDGPSAYIHGQQALTLARQSSVEELVARSLNVLAYAAIFVGRCGEAVAYAVEARTVYAGLGNRAMEADSMCALADAYIRLGQTQSGLQTAHEAYALSQTIDNAWGQVISANLLAEGLLDAGNYEEAWTFATTSVNTARTNDLQPLLGYSLIRLGALYRELGNVAAAQATHTEAWQIDEALPSSPAVALIAGELCADYGAADDWEAALEYLNVLLKAHRPTFYLLLGRVRPAITLTLIRSGRMEHALKDLESFGVALGDSLRYRLPYLRAEALLAQHQNDLERALAALQAAYQLAVELELPVEQWQLAAALSHVHQARKELSQAQKYRDQAITSVQQLAQAIRDPGIREQLLSAANAQGEIVQSLR